MILYAPAIYALARIGLGVALAAMVGILVWVMR